MSTSEFERLVNLRAWSNAVVNQPREEGRDRRVVAGAIGLYQRCTPHTLALLRARRERPRRRTAKKSDELAPPHSITSSARASSAGEISRPSALAVLRLITSSNLVGCWTGKSPGLAPLKILSMNNPCRRNTS